MISIGVDGGGTKTAFMCEANGVTSSLVLRTPSNPNTVGIDAGIAVICEGIERICTQNKISPDEVNGIFCGIAGATGGSFIARCKEVLGGIYQNAAIDVAHDGHNILSAAFGSGDGAIVICGTGSSCFVRVGGSLFRIGGYLTFDMAGSGYEIGRAAIAHALCCLDGREQPGTLCSLVRSRMGEPPLDALNSLLSADRSVIAGYAALVFEALDSGDSYADAIIDNNIHFIADCINAASRHFTSPFRVCMAGGVGTNPVSLEYIRRHISCAAEVFPLDKEPVCGALVIAKNLSESRNNI